MNKLSVFIILTGLFQYFSVEAAQIPMEGDFKFAVKTNTRVVRFSGDVEAQKASIQRTDHDNHSYEVKLSLEPAWFKTGIDLRDNHLRDQILKNRPLQFSGSGLCPELECTVSGELVIGDHKGIVEVELVWSENRNQLKGQSNLSLMALGIEAPSYLGVTVQDIIPVEFDLQVTR
jgi:hypothetical protein